MVKKIIYFILLLVIFILIVDSKNFIKDKNENFNHISNRFFVLNIPKDFKGTYEVKRDKSAIYVYDKISKDKGFGGFVFGIRAYKNPSEYYMMPGIKKLGEVVGKNGEVYDVIRIHPTDVQYDYVNKDNETYKKLYDYSDHIGKNITGRKTKRYFYKQGMKGQDLYEDILNNLKSLIKKGADEEKLKEEGFSYIYSLISKHSKNPLKVIGYRFYDINKDGIDELILGEISEGEWKGAIYDIYGMKDRNPVHVVSGGERSRFYVCSHAFLCNVFSNSAQESGLLTYVLETNDDKLSSQVGFKEISDGDNTTWLISYGFEHNKWEKTTKETYEQRKGNFKDYKKFDFIPLENF